MDFACSFKHPTIFHVGEGTSYRILDPLCPRFRRRNFSYNVFDPKIGSKTRSLNKMRKRMAYSGCLSSNLVFKGKFDSHLCSTYSSTSLFHGLHDVLKVRGVRSRCQGNDSLAYADGNGQNVEFVESNGESLSGTVSNGLEEEESGEVETPTVDESRELLLKAMKELEVACRNSRMFEEKAQNISEAAIALKDEATNGWNDVNSSLGMIQNIVNEECVAKEAVQKATMALSLAEARLQVAVDSFEPLKEGNDSLESSGESDVEIDVREDNGALLAAQDDIRECREKLANCEAELRHLQNKKEEL